MSVSADNSSVTHADSVSMATEEEDVTLMDTDVEKLAQYFGFLPQSFMNGMYNSMLEYLKEAIKSLNEAILTAYKDKISEAELTEITSKQGQAAVHKLDKLFDKAETYLNINVFSLPRNLILSEDRPQIDNPCSEEQMQAIDRQLKEGKDKLMALKLANSVLRQKMSDMDALQKDVNSSLESIQKVHQKVIEESGSLQEQVDETDQVVKTLQEFDSLIII